MSCRRLRWIASLVVASDTREQGASLSPSHTYQYDGAGNMTFDNSKAFTYTADNLLATVGGTSNMLWDAAKNRIGFTASDGGAYTFVYDPTAGIPAVIEEWTPAGTVQYVREPGGALIARVAGSETQYYHFSDLGSTQFLTNAGALVTDRYTYDAWGADPTHVGPTDQPYQYVGQMGYYTHVQDSNMGGLLQLGVRFYVPVLGRFTQRDPLAQTTESAGTYASGSPTLYSDPLGLYAVDQWCCNKADQGKIAKAVDQINDDMLKPGCLRAIKHIGCFSQIKKGLPGVSFTCGSPGKGAAASTTNSEITVVPASLDIGDVWHELAHVCFNMRGEGRHGTRKLFRCPFGCGRVWDPAKIPPPMDWDPHREKAAERLRHECGYK